MIGPQVTRHLKKRFVLKYIPHLIFCLIFSPLFEGVVCICSEGETFIQSVDSFRLLLLLFGQEIRFGWLDSQVEMLQENQNLFPEQMHFVD